jgi:aldose 1-epimerase
LSEHGVERRSVGEYEAIVLSSVAEDIAATFVPHAGMVCCSLSHRGAELLDQREGLDRYVRERGTMGIPFLHPYANRLSEDRFEIAGGLIDVAEAPHRAGRDPNGLAIHGLMAGAPEWQVAHASAGTDGASLCARVDWPQEGELAAAFPFPHAVEIDVRLRGTEVGITTTITATGELAVPISYGFHPYLRLPDAPRRSWEIEMPVSEHVVLDQRSLPTGERKPVQVVSGALGDRTFDDVYARVATGAVFAAAGGGRRIEVEFSYGYPIAVIYAPDDDDVICFEPMTAPTNAMIDRPPELCLLEPGGRHRSRWAVRILDTRPAP